MKRINLSVDLREKSGKGPARSLRREGKIPGILFGSGESLQLTLNSVELGKSLGSSGGENSLVNLKINGLKKKGERTAIFRDFQYHPVTGKLLHVDLFEVAMDAMIRVKVPLEITGGVPVGVKTEGGVLHTHLREIEIECLPLQIPEKVPVDVSELRLGESFNVKHLKVEEGVRILEEERMKVVSVTAPMSEAKLEELLASPAEAEVKEPEVVSKEKKEGEAAKGEEKKEERIQERKGIN
jgi:large subunit ribosomal protein L25